MCDDSGVLLRLGRDGNFDLGVFGGELGESFLDEVTGTASLVSSRGLFGVLVKDRGKALLHAFRTSGPVAVVEVHLPALQHEGANAILLR